MGEEKKEEDKHKASSARRQQLRDADANNSTIPTVSNFFPLERYYEASDKVLQTFETAFEAKRLDEAYVYGMRYCTFCVKGIVTHDYYHSSKFVKRKIQTNQRVDAVLTKLENVAEWMDAEEIKKEEQRKAILRRQQEERRRKQSELEKKRIAELERRIAKQKADYSGVNEPAAKTSSNVEESALAKLQRLSQSIPAIPPPMSPPTDSKRRVSFNLEPDGARISFNLEPDGRSFSTARSSQSSLALPPPILPPELQDEGVPDNSKGDASTPPSYQQILASQASYFGPEAVRKPNDQSTSSATASTVPQAPSYEAIMKNRIATRPKQVPKRQSSRETPRQLSIRQHIPKARQLYQEYQQKQWIQVSALNTYQGRVGGSTNGCTVISACVVSKHLESRTGVTDSDIQSVVDRECIPLLRAIRSKLGLGGSSLIIPSDVHDHMVDHKLLFQHKFVGAAGGNICDPNHRNEVYKMLQGEPGKTQHLKAGATLFFREHVISIVKFPTSPTEAIYDLVDSLPTCNGRASRTRCANLKALMVLLDWYTSHKFSESNVTYIERNSWTDAMADFDPRVFQAFVWADLPKPAKAKN